MVRHDWPNGHEFEQVPGDGEGQGSPACCKNAMDPSPWGHAKSAQLSHWTETTTKDNLGDSS